MVRIDIRIESNITVGGVAIHLSPDQVNKAKSMCNEIGASLIPGYSEIQENTIIQGGNIEHVAQVTNDAISVIQEWESKS